MEEIKIENDIITKKKSNTLLKILFVFIILFVSIGGIYLYKNNSKDNNDTNKKEQITPIMYEITKDGSNNKIYLFGSMHMVNHDEFEYPNYVLNAYKDSDYLACEFDVVKYKENMDTSSMIKDFLYTDGTTVKDHLSKETYDKLINFLKEKYTYNESLDYYNLYFFETMVTQVILNNSNVASGSAVDEYFLSKAKEDNKTILEVESYELQLNVFKSLSDKIYELEINSMIDEYEESIESLNKLYDAWKKGDVDTIMDENESDDDKYTEEELKLLEDYNNKVLYDRNVHMTDELIKYFDNNYRTFYMVGAAHLVGDKGIANLLEQKGYKVTRITK